MSLKGTIRISGSMGGLSIETTVTREGSGGVPPQEKSLPKADAGTLSTRTNDTDGTLTLGSGHGVATGNKIDIFWTDANGNLKCAYGATVGTVAGNSVPFTGASGDVLPALDSAITADVQTALDCDFDGDKLKMILAKSDRNGNLIFEDSGNAVLDHATLLATEPYFYYSGAGQTNPLSGNPVDEIRVTNADSVNAATFQMNGIYNSDA